MKKYIKYFDYFGVNVHFLYQSEYKYHSVTGGLLFIFFILLTITYIACNLKPFLTRKNMTLIFYDKKIETTDEIDFENYTSRFAFGFICDGYENRSRFEDLFKIEPQYVVMSSINGERKKKKEILEYHNCDYNDFYNEFNESFDINGFNRVFCPNETKRNVNGIYQDEIFRYIEIGISVIDPENNVNEITNLIHNHECRLAVHHIDTAVNVYDYSQPIKRYIATHFLTLKLNMLAKMNLYFNQIMFDSYENYLFDRYHRKYLLGFSSFEMYEDEKGYDRFTLKPDDYLLLGKIYVRAGLERTIIQRKYMKLTEFAANMSSILYQVLLFLFFVGTQLNKLYSNRALTGNIFQFKDISSENSKKKREVIDKFKEKIKWNTASFDATDILKLKEENKHIRKKNVTYMETHKKDIQNSVEMLTQPKTSIHIMRKKTAREDKKVIFKKLSITAHFFEVGFMKYLPCIQYKRVNLKNKLYLLGKQKIDYLLDVLTYLKKVQEIEILSNILLDINQINLVHFLAKPSISISNLKNGNRYHHNIDIKDNEIDEYYNYVKYLRNKGNKSLVEERLLSLATSQIDELIKN